MLFRLEEIFERMVVCSLVCVEIVYIEIRHKYETESEEKNERSLPRTVTREATTSFALSQLTSIQ